MLIAKLFNSNELMSNFTNIFMFILIGKTYCHQLYSEECKKTDADQRLVLVEAVHKGSAITGCP